MRNSILLTIATLSLVMLCPHTAVAQGCLNEEWVRIPRCQPDQRPLAQECRAFLERNREVLSEKLQRRCAETSCSEVEREVCDYLALTPPRGERRVNTKVIDEVKRPAPRAGAPQGENRKTQAKPEPRSLDKKKESSTSIRRPEMLPGIGGSLVLIGLAELALGLGLSIPATLSANDQSIRSPLAMMQLVDYSAEAASERKNLGIVFTVSGTLTTLAGAGVLVSVGSRP